MLSTATSSTLFRRLNTKAQLQVASELFRRLNTGRHAPASSGLFRRLNTKAQLQAASGLFRRLNTGRHAPASSGLFRRLNTKSQLQAAFALFKRLNTLDLHIDEQHSLMIDPIHPHTHTHQERLPWRVYPNERKTIPHPSEPRLERGSVFLASKNGKTMN